MTYPLCFSDIGKTLKLINFINIINYMKIENKEKPTKEIMDKYCNKIEQYLSAHGVKIKIELYDIPSEMVVSVGGSMIKKKLIWIKQVQINSQATGDMSVKLHRRSLTDDITEHDIWRDAWSIQEQIYKKLGIVPDINNKEEGYWHLWEQKYKV